MKQGYNENSLTKENGYKGSKKSHVIHIQQMWTQLGSHSGKFIGSTTEAKTLGHHSNV